MTTFLTGVPQGTILAPFLLIIYINGMLSISDNIIFYGEDTAFMSKDNYMGESCE